MKFDWVSAPYIQNSSNLMRKYNMASNNWMIDRYILNQTQRVPPCSPLKIISRTYLEPRPPVTDEYRWTLLMV